MEVAYQSIFEMPSATTLEPNDMFLIAKGSETFYSTYQTTFSALSAQVYQACLETAIHLSVISDESELDQSETSKAVGANIGWKFKTDIENLNSSAVKTTGDQEIRGVKTFKQVPKIPTSTGVDDEVPNCGLVKSYVQSCLKTPIPMFSTAFINQNLDFSTSTSRLCPFRPDATKFPREYSIYCIFSQTSSSKLTPSFKVSKDGQDLVVKLYSGSSTISKSQSACYSCVVTDGSNVTIKIDNKSASVQVYLSIFAGNDDNPGGN